MDPILWSIPQADTESKARMLRFNDICAGLYASGLHQEIFQAVEVMDTVYKALTTPGYIARNEKCVMNLFKAWYPVVGLEMTVFLKLAKSTFSERYAINHEAWQSYFVGNSIPANLDGRVHTCVENIQKVAREYSLEDQTERSIATFKPVLYSQNPSQADITTVAEQLWKAAAEPNKKWS
ncbi:hypothetical protein PG993_000137 [Apiospora rasikravindrae]|uniref:Uncharacterized protein n=1 Tax=Apiospora rasikravindrae TaxID=990691 RepID=A0ABR1U7R2_9PEZI